MRMEHTLLATPTQLFNWLSCWVIQHEAKLACEACLRSLLVRHDTYYVSPGVFAGENVRCSP